jgi:RNA polymerase sigma factor (sigma-70 family)
MDEPAPDLAALYLRNRETLLLVAASVLRNSALRGDYEDVVSDVFVHLLDRLPSDVATWEAYLVTMVKRKALDRLRGKDEKRRDGSETEWANVEDEREDLADFEFEFDRGRQLARVWAAIPVLNEQERAVLGRVFGREQTGKDIAAELGLTPGRISQLRTSGLQKMKKAMEKEERS